MGKPVLRRARFALGVSMCIVLATLPAPVGGSEGGAQSLREHIEVAGLRFVGATEQPSIGSYLTRDDIAVLVAAQEPATLNQFIKAGIPIRTSRLERLIEWGLLRTEDTRFVSSMLFLDVERAAALQSTMEAVAEDVVADVAPAIWQLNEQVWQHPGVATLPVLTAWMLRERVWADVAGAAGIGLRRWLTEQRSASPDRGFWGVLWYVEQPSAHPYQFFRARFDKYTILACWDTEEGRIAFEKVGAAQTMRRFLGELKSDGRKVSDASTFPGAYEAGLIDQQGNVRARALKYKPSNVGTIGSLVEIASRDLAASILRHLPRAEIAGTLGVSEQAAIVIAYMELVPKIVAGLTARGFPVTPSDEDADWAARLRPASGPTGAAPERPSGPPVVVSLPGARSHEPVPLLQPMPLYSAIIWKDLALRPIIELPW